MAYNYDIKKKFGLKEILGDSYPELAMLLGDLSIENEYMFYKYLIRSNFCSKKLIDEVMCPQIENNIYFLLVHANILYEAFLKEKAYNVFENFKDLDINFFDGNMQIENIGNAKVIEGNEGFKVVYENTKTEELIEEANSFNEAYYKCKTNDVYYIMSVSDEGLDPVVQNRVYNMFRVKNRRHAKNRLLVMDHGINNIFRVEERAMFIFKEGTSEKNINYINNLMDQISKLLYTARVLEMTYCILKDKEAIRKNLKYENRDLEDGYVLSTLKVMEDIIAEEKANQIKEVVIDFDKYFNNKNKY